MKTKILFATAATALLGLVGAGLCASNTAKFAEVKADASEYGIIGDTAALGSWTTDIDLEPLAGYIGHKELTLTKDAQFKVRKDNAWTITYGYDELVETSSSYMFYTAGGNDKNIGVAYEGTYDVRLTTDLKIEIYFGSDAGDRSVVFANSGDYTRAHLFDDTPTDVYAWKDSPYIGDSGKSILTDIRHAYDIYFSGGDYNGYHVYSIAAHTRADFNVILRNGDGSAQTVDILHNSSAGFVKAPAKGGSAVWKNAASAEYKVGAFLIDLGSVRGSASYKGKNFGFSICNVSQEQASNLVTTYNGLMADDDAKALLGLAKLETYEHLDWDNVEDPNNKKAYSIAEIMVTINDIASGYRNPVQTVYGLNEGGDSMAFAITISAVAASLGLGFIGLRKFKRQN